MFRRLLVLASLLAAGLGMSLATAPTAAAAPEDVTITAPGPDGDDTTPLITGTADPTYPARLFVDEVGWLLDRFSPEVPAGCDA